MIEHEREHQPYERVPKELKEFHQWVNWREDERQRHKIPVNPHTLGNAGVAWNNTWASFESARRTALRQGLGLGFVLTEQDPYTCIDLDSCVDEKGDVSADIRAILDVLSGWVELSPSGAGLHVWIQNEEPINRRTKGIEIYSTDRWMTVTGRSNPKQALIIPERTAELAELLSRHFPDTHAEFSPLPQHPDDNEIWERLFNAPSGPFFQALYYGDISVTHNDHSRAVIMLANQLALMTDRDSERMRRLLYQTGLVSEKWEQRRGNKTWLEYQIEDAIAYTTRNRR